MIGLKELVEVIPLSAPEVTERQEGTGMGSTSISMAQLAKLKISHQLLKKEVTGKFGDSSGRGRDGMQANFRRDGNFGSNQRTNDQQGSGDRQDTSGRGILVIVKMVIDRIMVTAVMVAIRALETGRDMAIVVIVADKRMVNVKMTSRSLVLETVEMILVMDLTGVKTI